MKHLLSTAATVLLASLTGVTADETRQSDPPPKSNGARIDKILVDEEGLRINTVSQGFWIITPTRHETFITSLPKVSIISTGKDREIILSPKNLRTERMPKDSRLPMTDADGNVVGYVELFTVRRNRDKSDPTKAIYWVPREILNKFSGRVFVTVGDSSVELDL